MKSGYLSCFFYLELSASILTGLHSYSRKGIPYDNAGIESFHASLKKEEVYTTSYSDFEEANRALFSYIEGFYNRNRIHSSIHYLTPQEFEELAKEKMA